MPDTTPAAVELRAAAKKLRTHASIGAYTATPAGAALLRAREPLAQLLELEADVIESRTAEDGTDDYAVDLGGDHALDIARAINGTA